MMSPRHHNYATKAVALGRRMRRIVLGEHAEPVLRSAMAWSSATRMSPGGAPPPEAITRAEAAALRTAADDEQATG